MFSAPKLAKNQLDNITLQMDNNNFTIPKNLLLNWLYSSDRHVPLEELGKWLHLNTGGRYQLIDLTESSETKKMIFGAAHDR